MVLAGGLSHERDVSLRSGRRVADALTRSGFEVQVRDVDQTLVGAIRSTSPEVVWPVLHGATGEDGALRDVLASLGIAYVGSRPASCHLTWDKPVAKALLASAGVSTPAGVALSHATFRELGAPALLESVVDSLGLPLAVKPTRGAAVSWRSLAWTTMPGMAEYSAFAAATKSCRRLRRSIAAGVRPLGRQALAALGAAAGDDIAATHGCHARTEAVPALADEFRGLISALHVQSPVSDPLCLCFQTHGSRFRIP